jgi:hypothetical protein
MCIIFYNENGASYREQELRNAHWINDDGVGIMWVEDSGVKVFFGMLTADALVEKMKAYEGIPHALHLRYATNGPVCEDLCHPFKASPEDSDQEIWMMHNGVLTEHGCRAEAHESDSLVFARDVANDIAQAGSTNLLLEDSYIDHLEQLIGSDKMVFFRDDGEVVILNPDHWWIDEESGIWYSNRYSVAPRPRYTGTSTQTYTSTNYTPYKSAAESAKAFLDADEDIHEATCICDECIEPLLSSNCGDGGSKNERMVYFAWDGDQFLPCAEEEADLEMTSAEYQDSLSDLGDLTDITFDD